MIYPKIRVLPSRTLSQILDLKNFATHVCRSRVRQTSNNCRPVVITATVNVAKCCQHSLDDRHLLIILSVHSTRDGRFDVRQRVARIGLR